MQEKHSGYQSPPCTTKRRRGHEETGAKEVRTRKRPTGRSRVKLYARRNQTGKTLKFWETHVCFEWLVFDDILLSRDFFFSRLSSFPFVFLVSLVFAIAALCPSWHFLFLQHFFLPVLLFFFFCFFHFCGFFFSPSSFHTLVWILVPR